MTRIAWLLIGCLIGALLVQFGPWGRDDAEEQAEYEAQRDALIIVRDSLDREIALTLSRNAALDSARQLAALEADRLRARRLSLRPAPPPPIGSPSDSVAALLVRVAYEMERADLAVAEADTLRQALSLAEGQRIELEHRALLAAEARDLETARAEIADDRIDALRGDLARLRRSRTLERVAGGSLLIAAVVTSFVIASP